METEVKDSDLVDEGSSTDESTSLFPTNPPIRMQSPEPILIDIQAQSMQSPQSEVGFYCIHIHQDNVIPHRLSDQ